MQAGVHIVRTPAQLPLQHIHWVKYDRSRVCPAMPGIDCSATAAAAVAEAAVDSPACYKSDLSQAEPDFSSYIHSV